MGDSPYQNGRCRSFQKPNKDNGRPTRDVRLSVFVGNFRKKRTDFVAEISDSTRMKLQKLGFQNGWIWPWNFISRHVFCVNILGCVETFRNTVVYQRHRDILLISHMIFCAEFLSSRARIWKKHVLLGRGFKHCLFRPYLGRWYNLPIYWYILYSNTLDGLVQPLTRLGNVFVFLSGDGYIYI